MPEQERDRILEEMHRMICELRQEVRDLRRQLDQVTGMSSPLVNPGQQLARCPLSTK